MAARTTLAPEIASAFARTALANVVRKYPAKPDHVLEGDGDLAPPRSLHRAFHASFDWHFCVRMHWLLELAHELRREGDAARWADARAPLARLFANRYVAFLPRQRYPIRSGLHPCSAFGLAFAWDYARFAGERDLAARCGESALHWFGADRDAPAAVSERERADGQLVQLDGLNLSRAWCMRGISRALPEGDARAAPLRSAADIHVAAGMAGLASGEYMGEHWLATFALLALTA